MSLSYISVDIATGAILADLTNLSMQGAMPKTLMRYESQTAKLPLDGAPANWRTATRPGSSVIICLADDGRTPLWGGLVIKRPTDETSEVTISLSTMEAYFDRVYVGDETFTATDQNTIVSNLVTKYAGSAGGGIPIRVQVIGSAGMARDRTYLDTDDKTLYSVLGDLSGVIGGPEWTVSWEATNAVYTPVLYVGTRIGNAATSGLGPNAVFNMPGPVTKAQLVESYASGDGANDVMATSSGAAGARPQSPRQTAATNEGRPRFEYRYSPSTSISDVATLTAHASRALSAMHDGSISLTCTASRTDAPILGTDWGIGDDIGFDLTSQAWPTGLEGTARAIGWQLDDNTITPILDASFLGGLDSADLSDPVEGMTYSDLYPAANAYPSRTTYPA